MNLNVTSGSRSFQMVVIYRPPPSSENKLTTTLFFDEFSTLLESTSVGTDRVLLTGDFNVNVDDNDDRDALTFLNILDIYNLEKHVRGPTHKDGHTLDLLITRTDCRLVNTPTIDSSLQCSSDHSGIKCTVDISRPGPSTKRITSRRFEASMKQTSAKTSNLLCSLYPRIVILMPLLTDTTKLSQRP